MPKKPAADQTPCPLTHITVLEGQRTGPSTLQTCKSETRRPVDFVYTLDSPHRYRRPAFDLALDSKRTKPQADRPSFQHLLQHKPLALLSQLPRPVVLFAAGAVSGAIGKTLTAPLDRVKLLLQTSGGLQQGVVKHAVQKGGVWRALVAIGRTEGIKGYWKGNLPQVCTPP